MSNNCKRVLIVSANPKTTFPLRLEEEKKKIKENLRSAQYRNDFIIETSEATTLEMFERDIIEFKPNILHFCGHGTEDRGIVLESESENFTCVGGKALAEFLGEFSADLECVVLNACFSEKQAEEIQNQIQFVIGMSEEIGDDAAISFSSCFYKAVFAHTEYEKAFQIACAHLKLNGISETSIQPKLFCRATNAIELTVEQHREKSELYLKKLKKGCEDKLKEINSNVYTLSGNVFSTESKPVYGADDFDLHIDYLPIDENGEIKEKTDDICNCINSCNKKIVILGEPGSGKSVSLLKLTIELVDIALSSEEPMLPILIPLGSYKEDIDMETYVKKRMSIDTEHIDELFDPEKCLFVFDALNELALDKHEKVVSYIKKLNHYIVSCRSLDYKQEFLQEKDIVRIEILDLNLIKIRDAIKNQFTVDLKDDLWSAIGGSDYLISFWENLCQDKREDFFWKSPNSLKSEILETFKEDYNICDFDAWLEMHNKCLLPLCRNPMLLKMVCNLYLDSGSNMPRNRGKLFEQFAEKSISSEICKLKKRGEKSDKDLELLKNKTFELLTYLANTIIVNQQGTGIEYANGRAALQMHFNCKEIDEIEKFAQDAGILISDDNEYRFIHQLHQEYFASRSLQCAFLKHENPSAFFNYDNWWEPTGWEEPAVILAGILTDKELYEFLLWISDIQPKLVIRCIENAGIHGVSINSMEESVKCSLLEKWLDRIRQDNDNIKSRIYIGQAIDKLGDPRNGVGTVKVLDTNIPQIEWISIADSGIFISKYPITVCQYATFLDDEHGYRNESFWATTCESQEWHRQRHAIPQLPFLNNAPMVNVSWYDAVAFCSWLSEKCNERIRLPYEEEWIACVERNASISNNILELDIKEMDNNDKVISVGLYDSIELEKKVLDVGLIWEWCYDKFGDRPNVWGGINPKSIPTRILKGGSWRSSYNSKNMNYRLRTYASHIGIDIGFRIVKLTNNY